MAHLMRMPEVAANATEAVLAEWLVSENAGFRAQEPIATVETEKAVVDVEAEADGVVLKTLVAPGAQVEVGAPIAVIAGPGERVEDLATLLAELGVAESTAQVVAGRQDVPARPDPEGGRNGDGGHGPDGRVFASPLARRMAREAGLAVEDLDGTGPRNRVLRRDVERALAARRGGAASARPVRDEEPASPRSLPAGVEQSGVTEVPHSRIRRATAARLTESKQTAPHFYLRATLRVDRLLRLRTELNEGREAPVSLNDLVVMAAGAAHREVPEMNVVWTPDAVRSYDRVDLAVAVATDRGLLTPVVRDVTSLSVTALAAVTRDLVERSRAGRLRQEELEGGTMSITNLGMWGTEEFAAIINPPHAAILAVGAVREEPVVEDGELAVGSVMRATLSVDHRPVDGVVAARWMRAFRDLVEHPVRMLA